ncbi:50S ribosomal protein L10 [Elizabethkingia sp. JS20170427COW]|uniref:50S ribosomal protein L10 n=1 Tax=Elizabethkingia sp. JS20170427COW TaxID=2583851 RepID=UPI0011105BF5|nr:50S ribosomal protein L10 [Elizabethkingia sp. JS20170427COW]QCX53453.1 50S ribosomal protein L10 [Elizabethkingia sp. JS20170427COW]
MTKQEKLVVIEEIKGLLQDAKAIYVADLEGLNASQTSDFRRQAFKNNVTLKVVKNTLLQKAMEQTEGVDFSEMFPTFKGNSVLMIADTANAPAKLIKNFRKAAAIPALKSAYLQETFYLGDENLETLSNIKSREEMIGEIIGLLQSPIQRVISALQNKPETAEAATQEAPAESTDAPEASAE